MLSNIKPKLWETFFLVCGQLYQHFKKEERATKLMTAVYSLNTVLSWQISSIILSVSWKEKSWQVLLNSGLLFMTISAKFLRALMHQSKIWKNLVTLHMSKDELQVLLSLKMHTEVWPLASKSNSLWRCLEKSNQQQIRKVKLSQLFQRTTMQEN